jgi:ubiquinone/menaquinone biosynthesis C-methylase UbiE
VDRATVPLAFNRAARAYDLLTGMNPGYRKHLGWSARRLTVGSAAQRAHSPQGAQERRRPRLLDLCCGTGLSTEALVDAYPSAEIWALDASVEMLARAKAKRRLSNVRFVLGDATDPGAAGVEGSFDGILMAYGIRNVPDRERCLDNVMKLLAPGASVCFHEYSVKGDALRTALWTAVCQGVILPLSFLGGKDRELYKYLHRSVREFDGREEFEARLRRHGFVDVHTERMDGWQRGIVHSFVARAPEDSGMAPPRTAARMDS